MGIKIKQLLNQSNKMVESVRTPLNERTVSTTAVKSTSVYGDQPRSLNIHWMKYDVTDKENYNLNHSVVSAPSKPAKLSPLRQRLAEKGEKVMKKRQLLTLAEIEEKIEETKSQECDTKKAAIKKRQQEVQIRRVKADEQERDSSVSSQNGLNALNQMNTDLEQLIRDVFNKMQAEKTVKKEQPQEHAIEVSQ